MFRLSALLLAVAAAAGCGRDGQPRSVLVGAAVSLTEALEEAGRAYKARTGTPVSFNFGASNFIATQVINGAPMDVFISADDQQMDRAARAGAIDRATRVALLSNSLVIVSPADRAARWTDPSPLAAPAIRRIAIGDPAAVPAGIYAKEYLERRGLWRAVEARVLPSASVRAALAAVASGGADAGIVYATDVRTQRGVSVVYDVPAADAPCIVYPIALTRQAHEREPAQQFVNFLGSADGRAIFTSHGFTPATSHE